MSRTRRNPYDGVSAQANDTADQRRGRSAVIDPTYREFAANHDPAWASPPKMRNGYLLDEDWAVRELNFHDEDEPLDGDQEAIEA